MSSSQKETSRRMYHAVQCVRMSDELLRELVDGPDEGWRESARMELERRASPVKISVYGNRYSGVE